MFNRQLQVKMVKPSKNSEYDALPNDIKLEDKAAIISSYAGKFVDRVGRIALSYVVLDTIRQVVVSLAKSE